MPIGTTNIGIGALNTEFGNVGEYSIYQYFSFSDGVGQGASNWHGQQTIGLAGGPQGNYYQAIGQAYDNGNNQALSLWAGYDHYAPFVLNWRINNNTATANIDYTIRLVGVGGIYVVDAGTLFPGGGVGFLAYMGALPFDDPWVVGDYRIECALGYARGSAGPAFVFPACQDYYWAGGTYGARAVNAAYVAWNLEPPPAGMGDIALDWFGAYDGAGNNIAANRVTDFAIDIN
jgi:hypothetical protein